MEQRGPKGLEESHPPVAMDGAQRVRTFWWARRNPETASAERAVCPKSECDRAAKTHFDLYCHDEGNGVSHFIPLGSTPRQQVGAVCAAGLLVAGLVLLSAALPSRVPLYVGAGLTGLLLLVLPLRFFHSSRMVALLGWLILLATAAVWREGLFSMHTKQLIVAGVGGGAFLALIVSVVVDNEAASAEDASQRFLASLLTSAAAVAMFWLVVMLVSGTVSSHVSSILLTVSLVLVAAFVASWALTGLVRGARDVHYSRPFERPRPLTAPQIHRPPVPTLLSESRQSFLERLAHTGVVVGTRIAFTMAGVWETLLRGMWWLLSLIVVAAAIASHTFHVWLTRTLMLIAATVIQARQALSLTLVLAGSAVRHWMTSTVLGVSILAGVSITAVMACYWFQSYLAHGSLFYGPLSLLVATLASGGLVFLWWTLTKQPWKDIQKSAIYTSERMAPMVFLALVSIGWMDGLAGILGVGPMHPGLMTMTGTLILATVLAYVYRPQRNQTPETAV